MLAAYIIFSSLFITHLLSAYPLLGPCWVPGTQRWVKCSFSTEQPQSLGSFHFWDSRPSGHIVAKCLLLLPSRSAECRGKISVNDYVSHKEMTVPTVLVGKDQKTPRPACWSRRRCVGSRNWKSRVGPASVLTQSCGSGSIFPGRPLTWLFSRHWFRLYRGRERVTTFRIFHSAPNPVQWRRGEVFSEKEDWTLSEPLVSVFPNGHIPIS